MVQILHRRFVDDDVTAGAGAQSHHNFDRLHRISSKPAALRSTVRVTCHRSRETEREDPVFTTRHSPTQRVLRCVIILPTEPRWPGPRNSQRSISALRPEPYTAYQRAQRQTTRCSSSLYPTCIAATAVHHTHSLDGYWLQTTTRASSL